LPSSKTCEKTSDPSSLGRIRDVEELVNIHRGKPGFLLGNGWSINYYDINKLKSKGIIVGCNRSFEKYPVDYLVYQDTSIQGIAAKFKGPKVCPLRRVKAKGFDSSMAHTYYTYRSSKKVLANNGFIHGHSGMLALQFTVLLGCNPVILIGCDCCVFREGRDTWRANIFKDRQGERLKQNRGGKLIEVNGKKTVPLLQGFAGKFNKVYKALKDRADMYVLGDWSILDMPSIDFPELWSNRHPEVAKRGRGAKQQS
jgi:hypothetical protein